MWQKEKSAKEETTFGLRRGLVACFVCVLQMPLTCLKKPGSETPGKRCKKDIRLHSTIGDYRKKISITVRKGRNHWELQKWLDSIRSLPWTLVVTQFPPSCLCVTEPLNSHKIHFQVILWIDLVPNSTQLQKCWKTHRPALFSRRWRVTGREAMINASFSSVDWLDFYQPLPHSSFYLRFCFSTVLRSRPAASCRKHQNTQLLYPKRKKKNQI